MKKSSKRKTSLKSSIIILLLVTILLIASSYAWFTSNQTVTVSSLDVNVEAKNGLQISVDGTNWKSIIQNEDITGATATYTTSVNQLPETLEPVSTTGETDASTGFMNMYYGTVEPDDDGNYILASEKTTETSGTAGKFIAFDLFFKVEKDTPVYLSTNSNVVATKDKTDLGLQNAARVAFVNEGNVASGTAVGTIQALKGAVNTYIWEPNYDVHKPAAVANAYDVYGITTTETGASALQYDGIKAEFEKATGVKLVRESNATNHSDLFATVTPNYKTKVGFDTNESLFTLSKGVTKIRVYMWIEGQDVDCENNASGAYISYNLQVTTLDA